MKYKYIVSKVRNGSGSEKNIKSSSSKMKSMLICVTNEKHLFHMLNVREPNLSNLKLIW